MVVDRCNGNKRRACGILDISYHTLKTYLDCEESPSRAPDERRFGDTVLTTFEREETDG